MFAVTAGVAAAVEADEVEVEWVDADGERQQCPLGEAGGVRFEDGHAVRRFVPRKGQRHLSGRWWCATTGDHVGFESWLERDHVMLLDFDPAVVGIVSQPFWLSWPSRQVSGVSRTRHAPDYFARRADGTGLVVDCRPVERREPADVAKFEATRVACDRLGWEYRLVGAVGPVLVANVRWLSGYRHPRHDVGDVAARLGEVFSKPVSLMAGAEAAGDPIRVLPVLFHLLWRHRLVADLTVPLNQASVVVSAGAR